MPTQLMELLQEHHGERSSDKTWEEIIAERDLQRINDYNNLVGNLGYVDCPICKNKGMIASLSDDGYEQYTKCECLKQRKAFRNIELSGLSDTLAENTFDKFVATEQWQQQAKRKAQAFADNPIGWLYIGGQSGSGKTHLCTAICGELLKQNRAVKYVLWRDAIRNLQSCIFDNEKYFSEIEKLKSADVLYIDDFLKSADPRKELDIAFEIINQRYISDKTTIISSEMHIDKLRNFDEAIAGRIKQKAKSNTILINFEPTRNDRAK